MEREKQKKRAKIHIKKKKGNQTHEGLYDTTEKTTKKRPPQKRRSLILTKVKHLVETNYLLPFSVAVFVAPSQAMSVTPRALPRSLRPRNILSFVISTAAVAGIIAPFT